MNLSDLIRQSAEWTRNSNVEIDVDESFGTVAIGELAFMQGDEADSFIESANDLYEKCGDVTIDECYEYLAWSYIECLS